MVHAFTGNALTKKQLLPTPARARASCVKNYIIYISNGPAQDNNADITVATSALAAAGGKTTAIPLNPSGSQDNPADEWARFLKKSAVKGVVYTIDVNPGSTGQGPGWTRLVEEHGIAKRGRIFQCDQQRQKS